LTHAPFFIVQNAGSGHFCAQERQRLIREILTAAGRQFTFSLVEDPRHLVAQAEQAVGQACAAGG
jgi:hypothetical protein